LYLSIIFLASILIDLDHIPIYFFKTKDLHPIRFLEWHKRNKNEWKKLSKKERLKYKEPHLILHGLEFIFVLLILSLFSTIFLCILIGVLFHLVLDFIVLIYEREHPALKTSQIWLWQRNKNRKEFKFT